MSIFNVEIFLVSLNIKLNEAELSNSMSVDDCYEKVYNNFKKSPSKKKHLYLINA